jgi:hypothetical protein
MKYVDMQEVAFDKQNVAFPGLGNCHGIVYVNNNGLFAYHLAGVPVASRVTAFGNFVSTHPNGGGPGLALLGFCPTNRFANDKEHKTELQQFATALNYNGKIRGHRWDIKILGWNTTYVELSFNQGVIMSSIEMFEDIKEKGANPEKANHKSVHIGSAALAVPIDRDEVTIVVLRTGKPTFVNAAEL